MFLRREHLVVLVVAASLAASAQPTYAQWHVDGVPLCTVVGDQYWPTSVSDGAGGTIATWADHRSGQNYFDIYAQHVLASGAVDPLWTAANGNADGTPVSTAVGGGYYATIATDGAGGAIIAWQDYRASGTYEIYAQHVLASGMVDPAWPVNGRALCTAAVGPQSNATIVTDGSGGAIIAWADNRNYPNLGIFHLYAQHVLASGAVDPAWPADGRELTTDDNGGNGYGNAAVAAFYPTIVTDGAGGAIATWAVTGSNPVVQHVLASGVVDPVWSAANGNADGTPVSTAAGWNPYGGTDPTILADGAGGAVVTWQDARSGNHWDIYAQHVLASGAVDPVWTAANGNADGTPVCTAVGSFGSEYDPTIATDGSGGAVVTWMDNRSGGGNGALDVYAQHVLATGAVDSAWPVDGRGLGLTGEYATIVTDGAHGAIVTVEVASLGIYAQHVLASGVLDPVWTAANGNADGTPVCTAGGYQYTPTIVTDGSGGAVITWMDSRNGNMDIYAQRIYGSGAVAAVAPGVPAYFAVHAPHPNPAHAAATISFDLPTPQRVSVGVYDVTGQLVRTLAGGGELPAGTHSLVWNGASDSGTPARAGIYFIRVSAANAIETRKVAIIP